MWHVGVQVEVLNVESHKSGIWCGNHMVKQYFGSGQICGLGPAVTFVIYFVPANGELYSTGAVLCGIVGNDKP